VIPIDTPEVIQTRLRERRLKIEVLLGVRIGIAEGWFRK